MHLTEYISHTAVASIPIQTSFLNNLQESWDKQVNALVLNCVPQNPER